MYESYTRQALPDKDYRELLGTALCVFNANNAFLVENILRYDDNDEYNWYHLIDLESGKLKSSIEETISKRFGNDVQVLFSQLVTMRNRIIHSFQITDNDKQMLATKVPEKDGGRQFVITYEYLMGFIKQNEKLCSMLYDVRGF